MEDEKEMVPKILFIIRTDCHDCITCLISKTLEVPEIFQGLLRMKINGKQNLDKR